MNDPLQTAHAFAVEAARRDFIAFLGYAGVDDEGAPFESRELDRFVWTFAEECFETNTPACIMLPFGAGKTTLACWRAAWELGRNANLLISIVSYSSDRSQELVELVRKVVALPAYQRVFPKLNILPGRDTRDRFTVQRSGLSNNPSVSGHGILTGTGTRTSFLLLDDIVTLKNALLEPANRRRVLDAVRTTWMSRQKMSGRTKRRVCALQTAYHSADAYAVLREEADSGWRFLIVRAEEPFEVLTWEKWQYGGCAETGVLPCPWPADVLYERARQMGPVAAARGLGNRPVSAAEQPFRPEYFEGPEPLPFQQYDRRVMFCDPAGDATKAKVGDPDWCGIVVIGYHQQDRCWDVLCADRMRGSPSAQAQFIAGRAIAYRLRSFWQEAVKDEALVHVVQQVLRERHGSISVSAEKPTTNKEVRIVQTLEPSLAAGTLRVCGTKFSELRNEALAFPVGAHDDLLDALAGAFDKAPRVVSSGGAWRPEPPRRIFDMFPENDPLAEGRSLYDVM